MADPPLCFTLRTPGPNELPPGGAVGASDVPAGDDRAYFGNHAGLVSTISSRITRLNSQLSLMQLVSCRRRKDSMTPVTRSRYAASLLQPKPRCRTVIQPIELAAIMIIRPPECDIRNLAVLAASVLLMALIAGCNGQPTEQKFPTPDPHALIPSPGPVTGAADLSVWVPDG